MYNKQSTYKLLYRNCMYLLDTMNIKLIDFETHLNGYDFDKSTKLE